MNTRLWRGAIVLVVLLLATTACAQPLDVIWQKAGAGEASRYGYRILPLGDQNDDGFADWAVMCRGGAPAGDPSEALIDFFHGGNPPAQTPYMVIRGEAGIWSLQGAGVSGDINGDGYVDWIIYEYFDSLPSIEVSALFFGGPEADTIADWVHTHWFRDGVFPVGDFNGDGFSDLYWYHFLPEDYGQVFYGGNPPDTIPDWTVHSPQGGRQLALPLAHGNLNGDGFSDWVSATLSTNTTYIFLGGVNPDTVPAYTWPNMEHWPLEIVNDLNGDGFDELLVHSGHVVFGAQSMVPVPNADLFFECSDGYIGGASGVGDFNRDGYGDLVLYDYSCDDWSWGAFSLYLGHPWLNPQPVFTVWGRTEPLNLVSIWTATGLGDINGDDVDDFAVGAWDDEPAGLRGQVVIFGGDTTLVAGADEPIVALPRELSVQVYPNPFNSRATFTFTLPRTTPVMLSVFNTLGQRVREVKLGQMAAGEHRYVFDADGLPSGVYLARVEAAGRAETRKVVLMR